MERFAVNEPRLAVLRSEAQANYSDNATPLPGTALKLDDQVMWMDMFPCHVIWGFDAPTYFLAYSPDWFGDYAVPIEGQYITDRAPADPQETPMPIYPQQAQQPQKTAYDPKQAVRKLLKQLDPEAKKKVRALFKKKRPELLDDENER